METVDAVAEVGHGLFGGGDTGVDVGLGGLCTHFLGGKEHAVAKFLFEHIGIVGLDISHVLDIRTGFKCFFETGFVDYLLAGGIDKNSAFGHFGNKVVAYAAFCLGSGRNVNRHYFVA